MSNGNLITKDYQFQLGNTLYGCGSNGVDLDATDTSGLSGLLGVPTTKTQDVVYNFRDGSFPNPDYAGPRVIQIPVLIRATSPALAYQSLNALQAVWAPVQASIDLAFQLPGINKFKVDGRPRGLKEDITLAKFNVIRALLRFDAVVPALVPL